MPLAEDGARSPPCEMLPFPDTAERRLRRALQQLHQAIEQQEEAVVAFRSQISALNGAVAGLDTRALQLTGRLQNAASEAAHMQSAAHELTATGQMMEGFARR